MNTPKVKKPLHPLSIDEWLRGSLYGSQKNKVRYVYCLHGDESITSIAKTLSGKQITKGEPYCYERDLDWKKLAQFNYGTAEPAEINWYHRLGDNCSSNSEIKVRWMETSRSARKLLPLCT